MAGTPERIYADPSTERLFTGATLIYIIINIVVVAGMRWLERRVAVPGFIGMSAPAAAH